MDSNLLSNSGMENKEVRRRNMLALAKEAGGLKALADLIGTSPAYLSHIKNKVNGRTMGDDLARRIEAAFYKHEGWMDTLHEPEEGVLLRQEGLPPVRLTGPVPWSDERVFDEKISTEERVLLRLWRAASHGTRTQVWDALTDVLSGTTDKHEAPPSQAVDAGSTEDAPQTPPAPAGMHQRREPKPVRIAQKKQQKRKAS